jgi:hypothetical protein
MSNGNRRRASVWLLLIFLAQFSGSVLHGLHMVGDAAHYAPMPALAGHWTVAAAALSAGFGVVPEHDAAHCALCQGVLRPGGAIPVGGSSVVVLPPAVTLHSGFLPVPLLAGAPAFEGRGRAPPSC